MPCLLLLPAPPPQLRARSRLAAERYVSREECHDGDDVLVEFYTNYIDQDDEGVDETAAEERHDDDGASGNDCCRTSVSASPSAHESPTACFLGSCYGTALVFWTPALLEDRLIGKCIVYYTALQRMTLWHRWRDSDAPSFVTSSDMCVAATCRHM